MDSFRYLQEGGVGELEEKKSRFIATLRPVDSEEEAIAFIHEMKKQYWDARHNCSAFVIGAHAELTRCSDDGEPAGSAGRPMLEVLLGSGVRNVCCVVTRYFGGTLLGTGGLVRAYQGAVKEGLEHCRIATRAEGTFYTVETDYNGVGKLQHFFGSRAVAVRDVNYAERVIFTIVLRKEQETAILREITDVTGGSAIIEKGSETLVDII